MGRPPLVWSPVIPDSFHLLSVWLLEKAGFSPQFANWSVLKSRPVEKDVVVSRNMDVKALSLLYNEYVDRALAGIAQGGRSAVRLINRTLIFWSRLFQDPEVQEDLKILVRYIALGGGGSPFGLYRKFKATFEDVLVNRGAGGDFTGFKCFHGDYYREAEVVKSLLKVRYVDGGGIAFYTAIPGRNVSLFVFLERKDVEVFIYHRPQDNRLKMKVRGDRPPKLDPGYLGAVMQRFTLYEPKVLVGEVMDMVLR